MKMQEFTFSFSYNNDGQVELEVAGGKKGASKTPFKVQIQG